MGCDGVIRNSSVMRRADPAGVSAMRSCPSAKSRTHITLQLAGGLKPARAELHACARM